MEINNNFTMEYIKKHRFLLLLIFLLGGIAYPLFSKNPHRMELLSTFIYTFIMLSGLYAFSGEGKFLRITGIFFFITIALEWLQFFTRSHILDAIQPLTTSVVLVLLLIMTLRDVRMARVVDQNVIFGVVAGYILIGFVGGLLALAVARSYPDAFNLPGLISGPEALYFSFITMTTLGYGDITPSIQETRSLSILLSIVGPMYVAIIVALMVGKFAARNDSKA
jgi:voltage-gated potassium channel